MQRLSPAEMAAHARRADGNKFQAARPGRQTLREAYEALPPARRRVRNARPPLPPGWDDAGTLQRLPDASWSEPRDETAIAAALKVEEAVKQLIAKGTPTELAAAELDKIIDAAEPVASA